MNVTVHLSDILMRQFPQLQVYQHITFQDAVVEHQIHIEILVIVSHPFLTTCKAETPAKFQKEVLQVGYQAFFHI